MSNTSRPTRARRPQFLITAAIAAGIGCSILGCARSYYRKSADHEAERLIAEKADNPRWPLPVPSIEAPADSRLFDPANPDHPPMPPDDPASHKLMERVDGMRGARAWQQPPDDEPRPDAWLKSLPRDSSGQVVLNLHDTVQIGLKNARDFQTEREGKKLLW